MEGPKGGRGRLWSKSRPPASATPTIFTLSGADPEGCSPRSSAMRARASCVEVGEGVTSLKPGDHVIPLYTAECRECEYCLHPKTNLCQSIRATQGQGLMPDGTSRFSTLDGEPILHYMGCSTFSNHTVLPEISLAKINPDAPFDKVCYIGCGVTTGIGAVINTAKVEIGSRAIVFGLGGIGLNVIQGLRLIGADQIVGVDVNPQETDGRALRHDRFRQSDRGRGRPGALSRGPDQGRRRLHLRRHRQRAGHARGAGMRAQGLGRVDHHRRGPAGARRSPPGRSSWSPAGPGAARPSAARGAARTCRRSSTGTWTARSRSTR
jgi:hypothetical protein